MKKNLRLVAISVVVAALTLFIYAPAEAVTYYDFASDTQGWAADDWGYGTPTLSWSSFNGGALEIDTSTMTYGTGAGLNWAKALLKGDLSSFQDLTGTPYYSLDIWIPANMYNIKAKLGVRTGGLWTLYQGAQTGDLSQLTWQTIGWDLSGVGDLDDVRQFNVEVEGWCPDPKDANTPFYIDNVAAIPEPASLLLLGTGLIGIFGFRIRRRGVK